VAAGRGRSHLRPQGGSLQPPVLLVGQFHDLLRAIVLEAELHFPRRELGLHGGRPPRRAVWPAPQLQARLGAVDRAGDALQVEWHQPLEGHRLAEAEVRRARGGVLQDHRLWAHQLGQLEKLKSGTWKEP